MSTVKFQVKFKFWFESYCVRSISADLILKERLPTVLLPAFQEFRVCSWIDSVKKVKIRFFNSIWSAPHVAAALRAPTCSAV